MPIKSSDRVGAYCRETRLMFVRWMVLIITALGLTCCATSNPRTVDAQGHLQLADGYGLAQAQLLVNQGNVPGAIKFSREYILKHPADPAGHYTLGTLLNMIAKWDEAVSVFQTCVNTDPKHYAAHNNLGIALLSTGKITKAKEAFRRAAMLDDKGPEPWLNLAIALTREGRYAAALETFETAHSLAPDALVTQLGVAEAALRLGRLNDALERYTAVVARFPKSTDAHIGLAATHRQNKKYKSALHHANQAMTLNPLDPECTLAVALTYDAQGKVTLAEQHYTSALKLNKSLLSTLYNYGFFLAEHGRSVEAVPLLERYLKLAPKADSATRNVRMKLKQIIKQEAP